MSLMERNYKRMITNPRKLQKTSPIGYQSYVTKMIKDEGAFTPRYNQINYGFKKTKKNNQKNVPCLEIFCSNRKPSQRTSIGLPFPS